MSSVVIAGDTSGTVTLAAPAVSGTTTLTLPATSGTLLQSGTAVTVAQGGTGLTSVGSSGNLLTSNGTAWVSSAPASSGPVLKYVTDSTDINVTVNVPSYVTIGSTISASIPTNGFIRIATLAGKFLNVAAEWCGPTFGIRIASTNYWFGDTNTQTTHQYNGIGMGPNTNAGQFFTVIGNPAGAYSSGYTFPQVLDVVASGLPTGTQTIQLIVSGNLITATPNWTIKGTTTTTRVGLEFVSV